LVVGPEVARERTQRRFEQRRDEIWADDRRPGESRRETFGHRARAAMAASGEYRHDLAAAGGGHGGGPGDGGGAGGGAGAADLATFLPPLGKRLDRLAAMGARLAPDGDGDAAAPARARPTASPAVMALGWAIGIPLVALIAVLFVALFLCLGALIYLALLFELALVAPFVAIAHALLQPG
jgi:hypothetical protein